MAVKVFRLDITPEQARALADELSRSADAGLFHPSIVEPIAAGVEGTVAYRAEEYVAAETLDVAMRHYAPAGVDKILPYITQLAGAIDFARAAGVGHGALHPRDVFITPEEARASGFGVVDAFERVGLRAPVRRPYTAPERIDGGDWGTPADIFSLAAITYELLTARRPSGTGTQIGTLTIAEGGQHADALLAALARAMDPNPARRYPTALGFVGALESAARGDRSSTSPVAAAAQAAPVLPVLTRPGPETPDDISDERYEDEAHHELTLHEREGAEAAAAAALLADERTDDPEAEADRLLVDAAAVASDDSSKPYRNEFQPLPIVVGAESARASGTGRWDIDSGPRTVDRDADDRAIGGVVPASKPRIVPLAAMLSIGLLVGFAVGYGVGSRDPAPAPVSRDTTSQAPRTTPSAGRDYSEQTVAQPQPGARQQPSAIPPPVPSETPSESGTASRPLATVGRLTVRSTPSRAGVTVNGRWSGRTPLIIERLPFGKYSVRVVQPGYAVAREDFALSMDDSSRTLSVRLEPQETRATPARTPARPAPSEPVEAQNYTGSIFVDSRPRGARVFVDGRVVGSTPVSVPDVRIGSHVVRLELPDHRAWSSSTRVTAGQQARVTGSLERLR